MSAAATAGCDRCPPPARPGARGATERPIPWQTWATRNRHGRAGELVTLSPIRPAICSPTEASA